MCLCDEPDSVTLGAAVLGANAAGASDSLQVCSQFKNCPERRWRGGGACKASLHYVDCVSCDKVLHGSNDRDDPTKVIGCLPLLPLTTRLRTFSPVLFSKASTGSLEPSPARPATFTP